MAVEAAVRRDPRIIRASHHPSVRHILDAQDERARIAATTRRNEPSNHSLGLLTLITWIALATAIIFTSPIETNRSLFPDWFHVAWVMVVVTFYLTIETNLVVRLISLWRHAQT
jgi:hypothetical protein